MFENIIAQPVTALLRADMSSNRLAPSMLFFGPPASGKGSTALETARAVSCNNVAAPWNCTCPDCARHRSLLHPDLVMIGPRNFAAEIAASRTAFLRDPTSAAGRSLFIRSVRKLLARFSPAVWEYESKSGRVNPLSLLQSLEEELGEFESLAASSSTPDSSVLEKLIDSLIKNSLKLEDECMGETIPIAQIRRAAYWSRLSPLGKRKTLIIENADRMKDEARNSLLKLLEEPPESVCIILTAPRRESLLPTILSRLRPYRFVARSADEEREIIRRVFRDSRMTPSETDQSDQSLKGTQFGLVASYLDSFLPQSSEKLLPLAAFFVAAVARSAAIFAKNRRAAPNRAPIASTLTALGNYCAPIAESADFERLSDAKGVIAALLSRSGNFEGRSFARFLALSLDLVSWSLKQQASAPGHIACCDVWRKRLGEAQSAYGIWNQRPELTLESLFHKLRDDMAVGID